MKQITKKICIIACIFMQSSCAMQSDSIYNNAKLIFHAIGPRFDLSGLEGIDPSVSISAMEETLENFTQQNRTIPFMMRDCIAKSQRSLARAKMHYLTCIRLVSLEEEPPAVDKLALQLADDSKRLCQDESQPSILFMGGHYLYSKGSLGGHTASYEVVRQENGKLSFIVHNTLKNEKHTVKEGRMHQLVYTDLEASDLDAHFWKNVIKTNYMNPVKGKFVMEAFYNYIDTKLFKGSNKADGRSFKCQVKGVCAWKSISVWLHGKIAPGTNALDRNAADELTFTHYKRALFENMLANFSPGNSLSQEASAFLKTELEKKLQKMNDKYQRELA